MTVLVGLCSGLVRNGGAEIEVLVRSDVLGELPPDLRSRALVRAGAQRIGRRLVWQQTALPLFARRRGADVLLGLSNLVPLVAPKIPLGVLVQNVAPLDPSGRRGHQGAARLRIEALRLMTIASIRAAGATYVFSSSAARLISLAVPGRSVVVLPPGGIATPDLPARRERNLNRMVVVADLYRYKGVEDGILVLSDPRLQTLELEICGAPIESDYRQYLVELARRTGVADRVRFRGQLAHSEVLRTLAGALCLLHPSRLESLGLPIIEALSTGTPVIAADIPASKETGGERCIYYSAGDVGKLADAIAGIDTKSTVTAPDALWSWDATAAALSASLRGLLG